MKVIKEMDVLNHSLSIIIIIILYYTILYYADDSNDGRHKILSRASSG